MSTNKTKIPWIGLILIILGTVLLLDRINILRVEFSNIFWPIVMLLGLVGVSRGFSRNRGGKIFFGTILFLYGIFFFLRSLDFVNLHAYMLFHISFIILGIAFLMMYINNLRNWFLLVPAFFFGGVGVALIMTELGYLYRWEVWEIVHTYWPLALILFGAAIILRRKSEPPPDKLVP